MISGALNVGEMQLFSHGRVSGCFGVSVPEKMMPIEEGNGYFLCKSGSDFSNYKFRDAVWIDRYGIKNIKKM